MSDPTKVYGGGVTQGGFDAEQRGAGFDTTNEAESGYTPGGPAAKPGVVNQGGPTQDKTYSKSASEDFLMSPSYKTDLEAGREGAMDIDNPDDISHADNDTDEDHPRK